MKVHEAKRSVHHPLLSPNSQYLTEASRSNLRPPRTSPSASVFRTPLSNGYKLSKEVDM